MRGPIALLARSDRAKDAEILIPSSPDRCAPAAGTDPRYPGLTRWALATPAGLLPRSHLLIVSPANSAALPCRSGPPVADMPAPRSRPTQDPAISTGAGAGDDA
jgi:hypothetical protein